MKRIIEAFAAVLVTRAFVSGVALAASSPAVVIQQRALTSAVPRLRPAMTAASRSTA